MTASRPNQRSECKVGCEQSKRSWQRKREARLQGICDKQLALILSNADSITISISMTVAQPFALA